MMLAAQMCVLMITVLGFRVQLRSVAWSGLILSCRTSKILGVCASL